jgi:hypothetical protein
MLDEDKAHLEQAIARRCAKHRSREDLRCRRTRPASPLHILHPSRHNRLARGNTTDLPSSLKTRQPRESRADPRSNLPRHHGRLKLGSPTTQPSCADTGLYLRCCQRPLTSPAAR